MSHIVTIKTEVRDAYAVHAACNRLRLPSPQLGRFPLFAGEVEGLGVQLPDWRYPVVCQLETGQLRYDNYQGRWGKEQSLGQFLQAYAVEKAKLEARRQGNSVTEHAMADGSIKVAIQLKGGAA